MKQRPVILTSIGLLLVLLFLFSIKAFAHGGGLDSLGCHHDRKRGGYHCHQGPLAGQSFASKSEALSALEARQSRQTKATPRTEPEERTVYITRTGRKYHGRSCQYLRKSRIPISLKEARGQGYTACSRCSGR